VLRRLLLISALLAALALALVAPAEAGSAPSIRSYGLAQGRTTTGSIYYEVFVSRQPTRVRVCLPGGVSCKNARHDYRSIWYVTYGGQLKTKLSVRAVNAYGRASRVVGVAWDKE
jgi:hypothetical protein